MRYSFVNLYIPTGSPPRQEAVLFCSLFLPRRKAAGFRSLFPPQQDIRSFRSEIRKQQIIKPSSRLPPASAHSINSLFT